MSTKVTVAFLLIIQTVWAFHSQIGFECQSDADCIEEWEVCREAICEHKDIFPMLRNEYVGTWITILILFITNCGGLGGGGALIPVVLFFFKFDTKNSIALSNASIFISATCRYLLNLKKPHPLKEKYGKDRAGILVDYGLTMLMLPMIVVGASLGVLVKEIMSEAILVIGLAAGLLGFGTMLAFKLHKIRKVENSNDKVEVPINQVGIIELTN